MNLKKRAFLSLLAACLALPVLGLSAARAAETVPAKWTLAVIGDQQWAVTQRTGNDYLVQFTSQADWLIAHARELNLRMVVQVGDIVEQSRVPSEWERAASVMAKFDTAPDADGGTGIPWSVAYGNHEMIGAVLNPPVDLASPERSATYRQYFGSASGHHRYANQPEFKGVSGNDVNTWHIIKSSNSPQARSFLMLSLETDIPGNKAGTNFDAMKWAQGIIDANPGLPTIITTHIFEGTKHGPPNNAYLKGFGHNSQLEIFDGLIKNNPQIFLVLSGHTNEETHQVKTNAAGQPVLQMVTDYSKWVGTCGDGLFRLLEFDEAAGKVRVKTYSAFLKQSRTNPNAQFEWDLDFASRFPAAQAKRPN